MEGDGRVQAMADAESSQGGNADSQESGADGTGAMESQPEETAEPTEEPSTEETPGTLSRRSDQSDATRSLHTALSR